MSDLNDEANIAEDSTENLEQGDSVEDSVNDSAEESDAVSEEPEQSDSNEDAFDYLDETETPQAEVDAQNLFKKFASMTDEQKAEKLKALESRPQTLEALNNLIEADKPKEVEVEPEETDSAYLERMRLQSSIEDFIVRNDLPDEVAKELKNPVGEISKAFRKLKFDPETGEKLSYTQKLKMTLSQSEMVQEALTNQKADKKAKGMVKATTAKMRSGGGGSTKADLESLRDSDPQAFLKELDKQTNTGSRYS